MLYSKLSNLKVSCLTAIVPSPDWFIGLSNVELCSNGKWAETLKIQVSAMDAGTDNGLTFTSPNWETEPRGEVTVITNRVPSHPAASFHYPDLLELPILAVYSLQKVMWPQSVISWE